MPNGLPSQVGFTVAGREYTPEQPCMFDTCVRADAERWHAHVLQWLAALGKLARSDGQRNQVKEIAARVGRAAEQDCGMPWQADCSSTVGVFISSAQLSKSLADSWGTPVTEVESDWGSGVPSLPIPGWIRDAIKGRIADDFARGLLPIALLALMLLMAKNRVTRGGWI